MFCFFPVRPKQPYIELITKADNEGYFSEGVTFQARCVVPEGRPFSNITWFLDNEPANKQVGQLQYQDVIPVNTGLQLFTTEQEIKWILGPEDNGRKLICRSLHQTDRESLPPQEASVLLLVRCKYIFKKIRRQILRSRAGFLKLANTQRLIFLG